MLALFTLWGSLAALTWTWAGYPALTGLAAASVKRRRAQRDTVQYAAGNLPSISVVVAVHDEERALPEKLRNCLELDYPDSKAEILVVSDGSRDRSTDIVRNFARSHKNVRLIEFTARIGKSAAQNAAVAGAEGELLLFTDVDVGLERNALKVLASRFLLSGVGCVTGRVMWRERQDPGRARSENLYWRYEHAIWVSENLLGTLCWASGPCMAVRRDLFRVIDPEFGDDVVIPFDVMAQGFAVFYEPSLIAFDMSRENLGPALRARIRMTLRSLTGTLNRMRAHRFWRRPGILITVTSHKLLRWATPFLFLTTLGSAVFLAMGGYLIARIVLSGQCCVVIAAATGHVAARLRLRVPFVTAAHDLALENVGMLIGVMKAIAGRRQLVFGEDKD